MGRGKSPSGDPVRSSRLEGSTLRGERRVVVVLLGWAVAVPRLRLRGVATLVGVVGVALGLSAALDGEDNGDESGV